MREAARAAGREPETAAGDVAAFERELVPLLLPAYRLAVGMLLDRTLAEDAVQDASLRAWDHRSKRRPGTDLKPWFLAIVANRCRSAWRGRRTREAMPETSTDVRAQATDDADIAVDVRRALRSLPRTQRLAVVLRFYLDLPYDDIASVLGCSVNAAKLRVSRATEVLRRSLNDLEDR